MPRATLRSGAADRTERSGQHRSWLSEPRRSRRGLTAGSGAALLGLTLLLSACAGAGEGTPQSPPAAGTTSSAADAQVSEQAAALSTACTEFWGDPDYTDPLSRAVLARAASAPGAGPSDPEFFARTGEAITQVFDTAPEAAQQSAGALADWFFTEPERGAEADLDSFRAAWQGLAGSCAEQSAAALWAAGPGEEGTKPAALVCADIFDTPGTLTHFANANVLTSNMFKLVGLQPREVPADRSQDVQATADLLAAQIAAVDDDAVATALAHVRAPFQDALEGDTWSDGLEGPLTELGSACEAGGYSSPETGEIDNDNDDSGAVVGASAEDQHGTTPGGRS